MSPASITQWLNQPNTPIDPADLEAILKAHPYFVPARYMEAATRQAGQPFSAPMLASMQLYMGNWLQFYQLMESASATPAVAPVAVEFPVTAAVEPPAADPLPLIQPVFTEDYFLHQGLHVDDVIPQDMEQGAGKKDDEMPEDPRSLMVVMSFSEWLHHFKIKSQQEKEEEEDRRALKTMWQKEKLAAAFEEENDEIPENVFEMAVNSITKEDNLVSESLAEIMVRQGKYDKAIDMYKKLSLRNPQKSAYFAQQIALIQKNTEA